MRRLDLGERFGGIVAWDSFFHLAAEEQRAMVPRFAAHLAPGGALLFTAGPEAGEAMGTVEGSAVYHASLAPAEYAARLEAAGLDIRAFVAEDPDCGGHSVWLARDGSSERGAGGGEPAGGLGIEGGGQGLGDAGMVGVEPGALGGVSSVRVDQPAVDRGEGQGLEASIVAVAALDLRRAVTTTRFSMRMPKAPSR